MVTLEFDSVTKTFRGGDDEIVAADDISMPIDNREFLVVVGPSSYGKLTALRMIAGLETIMSGTTSLGDRVISDVAFQGRDIAMMFQSYVPYPYVIARQNMSFGLKRSIDFPDDGIDRMVSGTADLLDIPSLSDREPSDLLGGQ